MPAPPSQPKPQRLASVDALRGLAVAAMLVVNTPGDWGHVYAPLRHAAWHGCTLADLVFPFFLFVVGVSVTLSLAPRLGAGASVAQLSYALLWRSLRIIALGLVLHAIAFWVFDAAAYRPLGVLQRIGLCVLTAGLLVIHTRPRTQWMIVVMLLFGYWGVLLVGGSFAPLTNLASRIDAAVLGPLAYSFNPATGMGHEPEGLLSTLPAIATTLLGVHAGRWLRAVALDRLTIAAVSMIGAGLVWSWVFPLNKNLWTSSYVLWSAGWTCLALVLCHWLIDRRGWPALGRSLGMNAIAMYAGSACLPYALIGLGWLEPLYSYAFANWMTPRFGPYVPSLAFALAFTAFWWLIAWWLDRRTLYFKL